MTPLEVPTVRADALPDGYVLLDVREDDEWAGGHAPDAIHVPMHQVPQRLSYDPGALTPDANIVVVCKVGGRSAQVTAWLRNQGYDAVNLEGGMYAWQAAGRPMVAADGVTPHVV